MSHKNKNTNDKQLEKNKLERKNQSCTTCIKITPSTQRKKFLPLAKVSLVDEKLSSEKGQNLQHLISKENHHKTFQGKKIKDKQEKLKQERLNQIGKREYDKT